MAVDLAAPDGTALSVEWDNGARMWFCWQPHEPDRRVGAEDDHLEGALAEALGVDVAHDDLPSWLPELAAQVRETVPR